MERIDLKATTKSTFLTLTLALALGFEQNTTKGEGAFLEFGGRKWTNGRDVTIVRERRPKLVWIETGVRVRVSRCFSSTRQLAKNLQRWAERVQ